MSDKELSFLLFLPIGTILVFTVVVPLMALAKFGVLLSCLWLNGNGFDAGYTGSSHGFSLETTGLAGW